MMVHIYRALRDLHSANGKGEYAQSCTPIAGFAAGAYDTHTPGHTIANRSYVR
jgi:hypothetical protein